MRLNFALIAVGALAVSATAQNIAQNKIHIWDGSTEYTSRARVGGAAGHVSEAFQPGIVRGLDKLSYAQYVIQDQDLSTQEPWEIKICPIGANGLPDFAGGNAIIKNLQLNTGTGIGAFLVTHNRNTQANGPIVLSALKNASNKKLLDPNEAFHFAWHFIKKANWTSDGISVHMSQAGTQLPSGGNGQRTCWQSRFHREIPRPEKFKTTDATSQIIERLAWSEISGQSGSSFMDRSWRLELGFADATLQGASDNSTYNNTPCKNPNEGYAALDPDFNDISKATTARLDNYKWTVNAGGDYAGGIAILFFSDSVFSSPLSISGINGGLSLDVGSPLFALGGFPMGVLSATGTGSMALNLGPKTSPLRPIVAGLPAIHAQAYVAKAGKTPLFSSLWTVRPTLKPAGFSRGETTSGTPISMTKTGADKTLYVRNDGPGAVVVKTYIGTNPIGPSTIIPERTGKRVILFPAATKVTIETQKSGKVDVAYAYNK